MSRLASRVAMVAAVFAVIPIAEAQVRTPLEQQRVNQAEINRLQSDLSTARANLNVVEARIRSRFESRDDYRKVEAELRQAQREYDQARIPVLAKLRETEAYKQASEQARLASERVERERSVEGNPTTQPTSNEPISQSLLDAIVEKMEENSEITRMEGQAIEQDQTARQARDRLREVSSRLSAIRSEYRDALTADPEWQSARESFVQASARLASNSQTPRTEQPGSSFNDPSLRPNSGGVVPGGPARNTPGGFVPGGTGFGPGTGVGGGVVPPPATQPLNPPPANSTPPSPAGAPQGTGNPSTQPGSDQGAGAGGVPPGATGTPGTGAGATPANQP